MMNAHLEEEKNARSRTQHVPTPKVIEEVLEKN